MAARSTGTNERPAEISIPRCRNTRRKRKLQVRRGRAAADDGGPEERRSGRVLGGQRFQPRFEAQLAPECDGARGDGLWGFAGATVLSIGGGAGRKFAIGVWEVV